MSRVHYGLLLPHEMRDMRLAGTLPRTRRYLAVPFVGKDAPTVASEFAHPDVAIGLTILAYRYEGLRQVRNSRAIYGGAAIWPVWKRALHPSPSFLLTANL